ncbi:hypothetical protein JQ569_39870 [Bradyrhizobium elkanii]|nr:hypothetical protein [Bradyrhizobium elkanii]
MISKPDDLPSDLVSALVALQAEREARLRAEAVAASAQTELSDNAALIAHLELHACFGNCRTRIPVIRGQQFQ